MILRSTSTRLSDIRVLCQLATKGDDYEGRASHKVYETRMHMSLARVPYTPDTCGVGVTATSRAGHPTPPTTALGVSGWTGVVLATDAPGHA